MTEQYNQGAINQVGTTPIAELTLDATPVDNILGSLTEDGQSLTILFYGGGSDPADVSTNNYTVVGFTTFTRDGGVVSIGTPTIALSATGVGPTYTFVATGDDCILRITGPAFPYNHRADVLRFSY